MIVVRLSMFEVRFPMIAVRCSMCGLRFSLFAIFAQATLAFFASTRLSFGDRRIRSSHFSPIDMATPHSVVMAAVRFIQAITKMDIDQAAITSENECVRVCSMLKSMTFCQPEATEVLETLHEVAPEVWTIDQRKRIDAAVQLALSGLVNVASDATRTCAKEQ